MLTLTLLLISMSSAYAEEPAASKAEKLSVDAIKEKYWAKGNETDMEVVQNRLYSKSNRLEFGAYFGVVSSDPFLNLKSYSLSAGYHLSEYWAINFFYMKYQVAYSSAYDTFMEKYPGNPRLNTNNPSATYAGELAYSPIYGKLSLAGKYIVYYDMHLLAGAGVTDTENGQYMTYFPGIGQQVYLSKNLSLRIDYRAIVYNEEIIEKIAVGTPAYGTSHGQRLNWNHAINFGFTILFDLNSKGDAR